MLQDTICFLQLVCVALLVERPPTPTLTPTPTPTLTPTSQVLLDIAYSLQYIHRMNLLHSDMKLENVLLKSDPSRPSGVTPKVWRCAFEFENPNLIAVSFGRKFKRRWPGRCCALLVVEPLWGCLLYLHAHLLCCGIIEQCYCQ